ncbi:MAG: Rrf2 family transcriptional regulator [Phycisphaeraceae bacterium]|nr:Rrf2 family transcriptional regulator [Phycisphaeraceae bacterium]
MISQTAEYALRAAVVLAEHAGECLTTSKIAAAATIPGDYLSKVLQLMSRAGLVHAQRGLHGGFRLIRDPDALSALEVITSVEQIPRFKGCPANRQEHQETMCLLHQRLDQAMKQVEDVFASTRISELVERNCCKPSPAPAEEVDSDSLAGRS